MDVRVVGKLAFIEGTVARQGYPPSMREIGQAVHLKSTSSVAHQVMALERKGVLCRDPHRPRAVRVRHRWSDDVPQSAPGAPGPVHVPLVGQIAAAPFLAEESVEDVLALPRQLVAEGQPFALKLERRRVRFAALCGSCGCSCRSKLRVDASFDRVEI
ncbi:hypothetical protein CGZ69_01095 [Streptomyces peucetius subsp. caesius ATCC 27952]|nr:hypothetical protein CGZ69_01095 [Streptomyces peucetius subsp. caesius ATCC 27952]